MKWYPDKFKLTYTLPSLFVLGTIVVIISSALISTITLTPLFLLIIIIFLDALRLTKKPKIAFMAVLATFVQLYCYGFGFLKSWWKINVLRKNPYLYPIRNDILPGIRILNYKGNRVIYTLLEKKKIVTILAILSNYQNINRSELKSRHKETKAISKNEQN